MTTVVGKTISSLPWEMDYAQQAYREGPDTDGKQRKAIVFNLRPVGTLLPDSAVVAAALAGVGPVSGRRSGGGFGSVETNRREEPKSMGATPVYGSHGLNASKAHNSV